MNDLIEQRKNKERSPNFPFITLENALERARQFFAEEKRGYAPFTSAAKHWGYGPNSSGGLQTGSALKSYGLMVDEGSGFSRNLKLSDLAIRILLDMRPDDTERKQLMRQAALTPNVAAGIYQKWPDGLPSDATLNHYLVLDLGFTQSTALRSVNIIKQNEELTKDNSSSSIEIISNDSKNTAVISERAIADNGQIAAPQAQDVQVTGSKSLVVRTERVIDPDGIDILLQFNGEPTLASYEFLKDYVELRLKALTRSVRQIP